MDKGVKPTKPKNLLIQVYEQGSLKTNVRVPFFMAKMGMKFGQGAAKSKRAQDRDDGMEALKKWI